MNAPALLKVSALDAFYGRAHILHNVALEVRRGEVVALMGRNGAGKSTTLKSLMGILPARRGSIQFSGHDITKLPPYRIARLGIGFVPEDRRVFGDLTVMENLDTGRQQPRDNAPHWTPEKLFRLFPNLGEMPDRPGNQMSGGEQQQLAIGRILAGRPDIILLDEPSEGVQPNIVQDIGRSQ